MTTQAAFEQAITDLGWNIWIVGSEHDPGCPGDEKYCTLHCPVPVQQPIDTAEAAQALAAALAAAGVGDGLSEWTRGYNAGHDELVEAIEGVIEDGPEFFVSGLRSALRAGDAVDVADDDPLYAIVAARTPGLADEGLRERETVETVLGIRNKLGILEPIIEGRQYDTRITPILTLTRTVRWAESVASPWEEKSSDDEDTQP